MNGIAKFECEASGNPPPSVFWTKEGSQELMFAGTTHGQMFVSDDGTLTIQVIQLESKSGITRVLHCAETYFMMRKTMVIFSGLILIGSSEGGRWLLYLLGLIRGRKFSDQGLLGGDGH